MSPIAAKEKCVNNNSPFLTAATEAQSYRTQDQPVHIVPSSFLMHG